MRIVVVTNWREILFVAIVTAAGATLRFVDLGHESIWLDEAFSLDMASYSPSDILSRRKDDPGNPPLYYVLLSEWQRTFDHPTIESARAFSALVGSLVPLATWLLAGIAGCSRPTRVVAALLVAFSPPLVYLSREARVYALFTLVATLAAAACEAWVTAAASNPKVRIGAWLAFTILASSFSYLHYYGLLLLPVFCVSMTARIWRREPGRIVPIALAFAVVLAVFLPWLPALRDQIAMGTERSGSTWLLHLGALPLYSLAGTTLVWKEDGPVIFAALDAICLVVVIVPAIVFAIRGRVLPLLPATLAFGLVLAALVVSVLKSPMLNARYLSPVLPCLLIVVAAGLASGFSQWARVSRVASIVLAALTVGSLALIYTAQHKEDWRPIVGKAVEEPWLPVFCYEDTAELSIGYYAPFLRVHPITARFSPGGKAWVDDGTLAKMNDQTSGFWFIVYLSIADRLEERDRIDGWLREHFRISDSDTYPETMPARSPMIRIYRARPKPEGA